MSLYLKQLQLGPMKNFVYLVGADGARETAIIDAAWDIDEALAVVKADGRELTHALVTHHHHDHTNGLGPLLAHQDIAIHCHQADIPELADDVRGRVSAVEEGSLVRVGPLAFRALHTPGHTPGSTTWQLDGEGRRGSDAGQDNAGAIFSGDTLFVNACGRCDFAGGDPAVMFASLNRLSRLNGAVTLYPGHDYGDVKVSSIAREKEKNPYFQLLGAQQKFIDYRMRPRG